ncbi:hypothetical protein BN1708_005918 [Verticillium longisporum]|uniref:Mitochondrial zinc maintenance protein 1, mitochondrial n=1 Tax=Verticillium longisporum TaxID=100787 RepID=A0A0G4MF45_VERLO|nr:hypothetical protein BN1708_005918 [Verticillium longisporum]
MTALVAYRNLWRAANIAFHGDAPVLAAARQQIRDNFREKSTLPANDPTIQPMIQKAEEEVRADRLDGALGGGGQLADGLEVLLSRPALGEGR